MNNVLKTSSGNKRSSDTIADSAYKAYEDDYDEAEEVVRSPLAMYAKADSTFTPRFSFDYIYLDPVLEGRIDERRQFAYFHSFVGQLTVFESDFWRRAVLQASYNQSWHFLLYTRVISVVVVVPSLGPAIRPTYRKSTP